MRARKPTRSEKTKKEKGEKSQCESVLEHYPYTRPFLPVSDRLTGQSRADHVRHGICRAAFMNELQQYGPVRQLFEQWGKPTGLFQAADKVAASLDAIAAALDMEHRSELFDPEAHASKFSESTLKKLESSIYENRQDMGLVSSYLGNLKAFTRKLGNNLVPKPADFVRDVLRPRWPWVAIELIDCFHRTAWFRAFGQRITRQFSVILPAPPTKIVFESRPGESLGEAWTRLNSEFLEAARPRISAFKKGKRPGGTETMARYARWFYEARIERKSIRSLAAEYRSSDYRSVIQNGVKEAERLLGLTPYTLQ